MKKRFFFDLLALLAIVTGFLILLSFQDIDLFLGKYLKSSDEDIIVDKTAYENEEYTEKIKQEEYEKEELEKQVFMQPSEEELVNCYYYSMLSEEEKPVYKEIYASQFKKEAAK